MILFPCCFVTLMMTLSRKLYKATLYLFPKDQGWSSSQKFKVKGLTVMAEIFSLKEYIISSCGLSYFVIFRIDLMFFGDL